MLQRRPIQEFHRDESLSIFLADVVNGADIRMIESGGRLSFASEAFQSLGGAGQRIREEFQGNEAVEASVLRLVDHTHTAPAESFKDAVMRNGLTNKRLDLWHVASMLSCEARQVNASRP
jgi:hypothetical protein